jgi:hypothetical protein
VKDKTAFVKYWRDVEAHESSKVCNPFGTPFWLEPTDFCGGFIMEQWRLDEGSVPAHPRPEATEAPAVEGWTCFLAGCTDIQLFITALD